MVEEYRGIFPIAHAERLSARQTGQRDLAGRRLPGARMSLLPAGPSPIGSRIERRPTIVADAGRNEKGTCVVRHDHQARSRAVKRARNMPAERYPRRDFAVRCMFFSALARK